MNGGAKFIMQESLFDDGVSCNEAIGTPDANRSDVNHSEDTQGKLIFFPAMSNSSAQGKFSVDIFDDDSSNVFEPVIAKKKNNYINNYKGNYKENYRKGEEQRVYPIKSREQLQAMADWLKENEDPKYLFAFILGINLGLRANELLGIRQSDLFFPDGGIRYIADDYTDTSDRMSIYQDKVDKRRSLYLNEACVHAIQWYYGKRDKYPYSQEYVFKSREGEGQHIKVDTLRKVLKTAAKECGIKQNIGTHTLRKTFGYFHYQANHDVVFLQRLFGHSSALVTMRYIGIADEEEKKAYHGVSFDLDI